MSLVHPSWNLPEAGQLLLLPTLNGGQLSRAWNEASHTQMGLSLTLPSAFECWFYTHHLLRYGDLKVIRAFFVVVANHFVRLKV